MAIRLTLYFVLLSLSATTFSQGAEQSEPQARQYTFAWLFGNDSQLKPRGGTTKGGEIHLDKNPSAAWLALSEPGISKKERDRRAILAMAGPYRTSFDFLETVGFVEGYEPSAPYQSWGTEFVYIIEESEDLISLQHVLVMVMRMPDGSLSDPIVVKHWRHDWEYEAREQHKFVGYNTWQRHRDRRRDVKGTWTQRVFQVDDSPRYQAKGKWTHYDNYSSWHSEETWRPLPRREFSVRNDYQVLIGTNKHTINPTGWVQEEENLKVVLDENGQIAKGTSALAKEIGLARYERVVDFDWSAGDQYWERTRPYWKQVRDVWGNTFKGYDTISLRAAVDKKPLFAPMFGLAREATQEQHATTQEIEDVLARYLK
ncbi:MAG: DUF6607 family protein [Pseudomonadota bacterium]